MDQADTVMIFNFRVLDTETYEMCLSRFKASRAVVAAFGGIVLEGTSEHVPPSELDEHGRYRRVATGWGVQCPDVHAQQSEKLKG